MDDFPADPDERVRVQLGEARQQVRILTEQLKQAREEIEALEDWGSYSLHLEVHGEDPISQMDLTGAPPEIRVLMEKISHVWMMAHLESGFLDGPEIAELDAWAAKTLANWPHGVSTKTKAE